MKNTSNSMSILIAYGKFRKNQFLVNRKYQRKLVWTISEKELLIDSIFKEYALPSFLLSKTDDTESLEILDGVQRLSSIFDFIENRITLNGKYFNIDSFPLAKSLRSNGIFHSPEISKENMLSIDECTEFLNYSLSANIITATSSETIDLFRRINSQGHVLSNQDRRRSGVVTQFSRLVDKISSTLRGDVTKEIVNLTNMPSISLDDQRSKKNYGILIEDTFWYKTGILRRDNIKKSEDEEFVADLTASVISGEPFPASQENFDKLYDDTHSLSQTLNLRLISQTEESVYKNMMLVFSVVSNILIQNKPNETINFKKAVSVSEKNTNPQLSNQVQHRMVKGKHNRMHVVEDLCSEDLGGASIAQGFT